MGTIVYKLRDSLYLNLTNRCTNNCAFCIRSFGDDLLSYNLKLDREPTVEEIMNVINLKMNQIPSSEIVFCGYGEPLIRLDTVLTISRELKQKYPGVKVRVDTNGQASFLHPNRNVVNELKQNGVDRMSISLNASDRETYAWICKPSYGLAAYSAVIQFIKACKSEDLETEVTIVAIPQLDIAACKKVAQELGVRLRIRPYRMSTTILAKRLGASTP